MSTVDIGNRAETAACQSLQEQGFTILERNYRRPHCEIDIVAGKDRIIYMIEVKYRLNHHNGSGLSYITNHKLRRMWRAAETWVLHRRWNGQYMLAAIEVSGRRFEVSELLEL